MVVVNRDAATIKVLSLIATHAKPFCEGDMDVFWTHTDGNNVITLLADENDALMISLSAPVMSTHTLSEYNIVRTTILDLLKDRHDGVINAVPLHILRGMDNVYESLVDSVRLHTVTYIEAMTEMTKIGKRQSGR